jgi:hypothetical protein
MIDEEEKQKYIEATKCEDCTQWHKYCSAECCKSIILNIPLEKLQMSSKYVTINPGNDFTLRDAKYYKIHDVEYIRGLLRFKKDRIHVFGRKVIYMHPCNRLDGNLCLDHPDKKPEICKLMTAETAKISHPSFCVTPNCLFKYKSREVKKNE